MDEEKPVVHTPNLKALKYVGTFTKKLFEVRADKTAILEKGDIVLVDRISAMSLGRSKLFEKIDISELFDNETSTLDISNLTEKELEEFRSIFTKRGSIIPLIGLENPNQKLLEMGFDKSNLLGVEKTSAMDKAEDELNKIISFVNANFPDEITVPADSDITFADKVIGMLERLQPIDKKSMGANKTLKTVLTDTDAQADLEGKPRVDNPSFEATDIQGKEAGLKPLSEFGEDKHKLEVYGKEFGIDLDRRESTLNMYQELIKHVKAQKEPEVEKEKKVEIPYKEDIETLSKEDIKVWCEYFKIKIGRKGIPTLKGLLLPYLPSKED